MYVRRKPEIVAKAFSGRSTKFDFYRHFESVQAMEKYIEAWKERLQHRKNRKEEASEKNRAFDVLASLKGGFSSCY